MPTMHGGSVSESLIKVSRLTLRRITTAPDASSPTTLQTFLPRSTPRTAISIPIPPPDTAGDLTAREGGAGHSISLRRLDALLEAFGSFRHPTNGRPG